MAYYSLQNTRRQIRDSNGLLVLPPLIVTLALSYAFVLMQPHPTKEISAAASHETEPSQAQSGLQVITYSKQDPLSPIPETPTTPSAPPSNNAATIPQASTNARDSLQAANSSGGSDTIITVPKAVVTQKKTITTKPKTTKTHK